MEERSTHGSESTLPWLLSEAERPAVETHHVWAPRPLGRSILWTPTGKHAKVTAGAYEVFVKQRALEAMYRHVWGSSHADEPFGFLFGDLCEDRESEKHYVVITRAVASAYPLYESQPEQISAEAARALRSEVDRGNGVLAGWYHRHREGPVELSFEDEATHEAHLGKPWQVALLFVTDPERASGGCFQPQLQGVAGRNPLPFYELAGQASLLARGVCKTRIDWRDVETETKVLVDPVPRPDTPRQAPEAAHDEPAVSEDPVEPVVAEGRVEPEPEGDPAAEPGEPVFELEALELVSASDMGSPAFKVHFDLIPASETAEPAEVPDLEADEAVAPVAEMEADVGPEIEPASDPEPEVEPEPAAEPDPIPVAIVRPAARPALELVPQPVPDPVSPPAHQAPEVSEEVQVASVKPGRANERARLWRWDVALESVVAAAAVLSALIGAWPLRDANATLPPYRQYFAAALAGFVLPGREAVPAITPFDESDPLTPVGQDVLAAIGRYGAVSEMYGRGRLACAPLNDAYGEVDAAWTAYGDALAPIREGRADDQDSRDEWVAGEVRDVETDLQASGCAQP